MTSLTCSHRVRALSKLSRMGQSVRVISTSWRCYSIRQLSPMSYRPLSINERAARFRTLHDRPGIFIIPNPWDVGSARILAGLGFQALATSSAASACALGRRDGGLTRHEVLAHAR